MAQFADFGVSVDNSGILPPKESPKSEMKDGATNTPASHIKPTEPYFIVPPGFRKNTYFVGMDKELLELDRRLFDKRRRVGTAAVLLHGQAGGGKSHLARQYIYGENRKKFTGGIFWVPARSREERHQHFWNIKQKVVDRETDNAGDESTIDDYVRLVKAWFEAHHNWLIIFDGVTVDSDEDVTDLADFIPDSKDCSIIYVSRAKNLESRQRLLRPFPIKIGALKEEEAKKLLFKELHIKKPSEAERNKATNLVKKVGGLPLAIDAISRRIADTHEPLAKYKLSYSGDAILQSTYNVIFADLRRLGHLEALNLIYILCWFAQDLPVEMVHLGLRILRAEKVEVRATETGGRPDINTTIGELMRYALIERNEPSDSGSMSSSHDSLSEPEPIDMLKIHRVVQSFCCDSLNAAGLLPQWLRYAVKLFSFSYQQADVKIQHRPDPGRVSDYRWYKVHGQRLWDHTVSYESSTQPLESIREELDPVIVQIDEEIRLRQPNSSQESLSNGVFQTSVFDRTSSSSDNSIPGPTTPNYRPTPPPLVNENEYGFPKSIPPIDSPGSFGTATPRREVHILGSDYGDPGYQSDREGHPTSHPMDHNLSDMTARPAPRTRAPTGESHNEGWQLVQSSRKPRMPARRDLGSFRPRPARAQVDTSTVTRKEEDRKPHRRESSPALQSLQKVHSQSPSPPRSGIASLFHRGPREPITTVTQPTWAGVAAGKTGQNAQPGSNPSAGPQYGPSIMPIQVERGRSRESLKSHQGNAQPSPLASEFVPSQVPTGIENVRTSPTNSAYSGSLPPAGFRYSTPYPGSTSSLTQIPQGRPMDNNIPPYYILPPLGPNSVPLPIDEGITITSKRPLPTDFHETSPPQPFHTPPSNQPSPLNRASPYQHPLYDAPYPPPVIPAGYYSQPMSRNHSHQSRGSLAETEPIRYPSTYSPFLPPTNDITRERYPDGRAFSKSPKTGFAIPAYPQPPSSRASPHDLSHTGGWTSASPPPAGYDMAMSRTSSGPGVVVYGTPGGIVPFENTGVVQFGEHPPVSVAEARRRAEEQALKLREQQREIEVQREMNDERYRRHQIEQFERARRESAPYPNINLIPTMSNNDDLQNMVGGSRPRGMSAPETEGPVGLGVRMPKY